MTAAELLREARSLISEPGSWVKGSLAADAQGRTVPVVDPTACRFCPLGAISRVAMTRWVPESVVREAMVLLLEAKPGGGQGLSYWNDASTTTHPMVLGLFDTAIAMAEREAA